MNTYIIASIITLFLLGMGWSKSSILNILFKIWVLGLSMCGIIVYLIHMGYIIKK